MKKRCVLIDYENVQPKNLSALAGDTFDVVVVLGKNQAKISTELVLAMQSFEGDTRYIQAEAIGRNSVDFLIAFIIGKLVERKVTASIHIVSNDTGFDSLVTYLNEQGVFAERKADLIGISTKHLNAKSAVKGSDDSKVSLIVKNLRSRGGSLPGKVETLANTIRSLFRNALDEPEIQAIIRQLQDQKWIQVIEHKVVYTSKITNVKKAAVA